MVDDISEANKHKPMPFEELGERIGLVAGSGQFPMDFAKKVRSQGKYLFVIAFHGETDPLIEQIADAVSWIKVGRLSKLLSLLKHAKISHMAFAGGISRVKLFRNFLPDFKALALAAKLGTIKDDVLLRALADEVEALGIRVVSGAAYLDSAIPKAGSISTRELSQDERDDALVGWRAAKLIGASDIGQSVIVFKSLVIAVEAVEGTDAALQRAGQLSGLAGRKPKQSGAVLVKVCKPQQDKRLDLPTIGPMTILKMLESGVTAAVVEAEATLILDPIRVAALADQHGISLYAARSESDLIVTSERKRNFSF